ncbi:MAG: hypothetical protein WC475_00705 [Candidatus Paceibacterota bacterium]
MDAKFFFLGLRQFILALIIIFGILIFPIVGMQMLLQVNEIMAYSLAIIGPHSVFSWLFLLVNVFWYPIVLTVWVARDAIKFKKQGIKISPLLWSVGTILPTIIVVFPIYFILRDVVWRRRLTINNINSMEQEINPEQQVGVKKGFVSSKRTREIFFSGVAIAFVAYVVYVVAILPNLSRTKQKTEEQVAKIHATKLTLDDVIGKNLPPDPGADADKTVQGADVNRNGIRDDVELAIFREYSDSAKTRAVLLQYALVLQMEATQKIVNTETVTEVVREQSRAYYCVGKILSRADMDEYIKESNKLRLFVSERQRNTLERQNTRKDFVEKIGSYSESENEVCDIDLSVLPN